MENTRTKICSTSSVIREMKINISVRCQCKPFRMVKVKKDENAEFGRERAAGGTPVTAGRNAHWESRAGNHPVGFS